jgi:[acyl-carrier-protein] S-malonyltransferase
MGKDIYEAFPVAKATFEEADHVLQSSFTQLMFEGPISELTLTENAQPAILCHSLAVLRVLESQGMQVQEFSYALGHSLGEYSALVASGALKFAEAVKLVRQRGMAMQKSVSQHQTCMKALFCEPGHFEDLQPMMDKIKRMLPKNQVVDIANINRYFSSWSLQSSTQQP